MRAGCASADSRIVVDVTWQPDFAHATICPSVLAA
jgi:hypothetical protein